MLYFYLKFRVKKYLSFFSLSKKKILTTYLIKIKEDRIMSEIIKNAVLASIGLISLTREKAEEFAKELIKKGELSENEKAKFIKDVLERSEKSKTEIEEKIEKTVETVMAKMNIPSKKEFEELKKKVEELSQLLNKKTE